MIVFDLKCSHSHQFEVWFRSSADYEEQKAAGYLECPFCGDRDITKAIMAPNVGVKSNQRSDTAPKKQADKPERDSVADKPFMTALEGPAPSPEIMDVLEKARAAVRKHVEENFDHVGKNFAEEARKIHYGEAAARAIYGETTAAETADLIDEGIDILPLPAAAKVDA